MKKPIKMSCTDCQITRIIRSFLVPVFFILGYLPGYGQNCTVNAGVDQNICSGTTNLAGNLNGNYTGAPLWTFVSGPVTPTIVTPTSLTSQVTGMTAGGVYVFRLRQVCQSGDTASQTVSVTAYASPVFTAGTAFSYCGKSPVHTMNATLPPGWTGVWTVVDATNTISDMTGRFSFSNRNSPTTTVQLVSPSCPDLSYEFRWEITSPNGVCKYTQTVRGIWNPDLSTIGWNIISPVTVCQNSLILFNKAGGKCGFWGGYNTDYLFTTSIVSAPVGFSGTISLGTSVSGVLGVNGLTMPGRYVFNATLNTPCGNMPVGPFDITVLPPPPTVSGSNYVAYCQPAAQSVPNAPFNFTVADSTTVLSVTGVTGPSPTTYSLTSSGYNRKLTLTPTTNWTPGGYVVSLRAVSGADTGGVCPNNFVAEVFIFDTIGISLDIAVVNACIPVGSTTTNVTFSLPAYPTYLPASIASQYQIVKLSGPAGVGPNAATMNYFASTGTINNLSVGRYQYMIRPLPGSRLAQEAACSSSQPNDTFTINVYNATGANAGTDQSVNCIQNYSLSGNTVPAPSYGTWTQVAGPTTLTISNIHNPSATAYSQSSTTQPGLYAFRWATADSSNACPGYADTVFVTASQSCPPISPLPLQVIAFSGSRDGDLSLLTWSTAREEDLEAFILEWSTTGGRGNDWMGIGKVAAKGNKTTGARYSFTHKPHESINYYRLKQLKTNGETDNSHAVKLVFDAAGDEPVIFPNPVENVLTISNIEAGSRLSLYSPDGLLLWRGNAVAAKEQVDMSRYPPGIYLLTVLKPDGSKVMSSRITRK